MENQNPADMREVQPHSDAWEFSKENVQPLKGGRNVEKLNTCITESAKIRQERREEQERSGLLCRAFSRTGLRIRFSQVF